MGKNKRIFQQKKGITLIALVVTVIIILILGSITINMAFGENGLLKQSQGMQANRETQEQEDDENLNEIISVFTNEINITPIEISISETHTTDNITIDVAIENPGERNDI